MVDYLQLVQGRSRGGPANRVQEITEISRALKVLAGEMDASVIACSQMSRMVENRPSHRPQLSDLRDSGSIEQDADVVAFIHREDLFTTEEEWAQTHPGQEYPQNIAEIIVAKNRKGPHRQHPPRVPRPPGQVRPGVPGHGRLTQPRHSTLSPSPPEKSGGDPFGEGDRRSLTGDH